MLYIYHPSEEYSRTGWMANQFSFVINFLKLIFYSWILIFLLLISSYKPRTNNMYILYTRMQIIIECKYKIYILRFEKY